MGKLEKLKFSHYIPRDEALREHCVDVLDDYTRVEASIDEQIDTFVKDFGREDPLSLVRAPRHHWDLKRRLKPYLEILAGRTHEAIYRQLSEGKTQAEVSEAVLRRLAMGTVIGTEEPIPEDDD